MISIITLTNLFTLAFAERQVARTWGSPAWHLEPENSWANQVAGPEQGRPDHPGQWPDSQLLSQWQEDATASLQYPFPNHNGHSNYVIAQSSHPQMPKFRPPGFSPYGPSSHYVRAAVGSQYPKYTTVLKHLKEAAESMTKHVSLNKEGKLTDAQIQYIMMLTAVNDLMDDMIHMGSETYSLRYKTVVEDAIAKVEKNPLASASSIRNRISVVKSQLTEILDFIYQKQSECTEPVSAECDKIIDQALDESGNAKLQTLASFLVALAESMELFSKDYLLEVAQVANGHGAAPFLMKAEDHIHPLVLAGAEARKIGLKVKLLPLLRTKNNRRHLNRLDNGLDSLRNTNHQDDN